MISVLDNLLYLLPSLRNLVCNVAHDFWTGNSITNSNANALVEKLVVDNHLDTSEYLSCCLGSLFAEDNVDKTALHRTNRFHINNPKQDLTIVNHHLVIEDGI